MSDIVIQVEGLGKQYALGGRRKPYKTLRESLVETITAPFRRPPSTNGDTALAESFWALKDVNFTVNKGEVVGIIGRNGAGKSTLLKILSRITDPTEGEIAITGRISSLLEVGTGFHPELSGRENIYLNGAILGMRRGEIQGKFDEIVAFAETEKFLDTPVKYYSSGMYTRLAFAVAAHLEPEILIVDEVLAVGDAEFQKKCIGKMSDVAKHGRTVLFVSHNMAAVQNLCATGLLLSAGHISEIGPITKVVDRYRTLASPSHSAEIGSRTDRRGTQQARVERLELQDAQGRPIAAILPEMPFRFKISGTVRAPIAQLVASVDLDSADGTRITTLYSAFNGTSLSVGAGSFTLNCDVSELNLRPDTYFVNVMLGSPTETYDFVAHAATVEFDASTFYRGTMIPERAHGPLMCHFRWSTPETN